MFITPCSVSSYGNLISKFLGNVQTILCSSRFNAMQLKWCTDIHKCFGCNHIKKFLETEAG